ncbi:DUF2141 domain-containing protein [Sphingomonas aracearum]|uniref:DUF2141 domain-containing protein n=1 Tax=Sphingomonas aracearum TaxID=2283317 RepID=A0A369VRN4_9SPHN|nr:DUF2141 domain-containing protein [Sphingomonas aracearum]RDE04539.1 DUF2141 domain-containing protein [Sphingomonas aracearum]
MRALLAVPLLVAAVPASAQVLGEDRAACAGGEGPAIRVAVRGLKDRTGGLKLELYPANAQDFTRDDTLLVREGKTFRRVRAAMPPSGPVVLCIKAPRPGRYALLFTHDRDGKNKFNPWKDGAGVVGTEGFGYARPRYTQAIVEVGAGIASVTVTVQYLRGVAGFGPMKKAAD